MHIIDVRFGNNIIIAMECYYVEKYHILLNIVHTFFIENDAVILNVHYTWKQAFTNLIHKQSVQVKL